MEKWFKKFKRNLLLFKWMERLREKVVGLIIVKLLEIKNLFYKIFFFNSFKNLFKFI